MIIVLLAIALPLLAFAALVSCAVYFANAKKRRSNLSIFTKAINIADDDRKKHVSNDRHPGLQVVNRFGSFCRANNFSLC